MKPQHIQYIHGTDNTTGKYRLVSFTFTLYLRAIYFLI